MPSVEAADGGEHAGGRADDEPLDGEEVLALVRAARSCGLPASTNSSSLSRSSGVATEMVRAASTVRLAMPVSTPPGPSSTKSVTPSVGQGEQAVLPAHRAATAGPTAGWSTRRPGRGASASTLETIGTSVSRGLASAMALRSRSRAGAMNGVWNAPDTGSGMTFLAPSSLASAPAAATPSAEPAITTWPGALKLATHTSLSARRQATSTWSSSRPSTAAMVPGLSMPASCMASARSHTRRTPSSKASAPLAVSAVYSPRLWPAQKLGSMPSRSTASSTIRLVTNVQQLGVAGVLQLVGVGVEQQAGDVALGVDRGLLDELPALVVGPGSAHARAL